MAAFASSVACFHPWTAWPAKKGLTQQSSLATGPQLTLPCGQCIGCRVDRQQSWVIRCLLENKFHDKSCFVTLTYAPEHLPENNQLRFRDLQLFMKRLRKKYGSGIRFFACGEYGDQFSRPHFHAILFGVDFSSDYEPVARRRDNVIYTSPSLLNLWGKGHVSIGATTMQTIRYVAAYCVKKITGKAAEEAYTAINPFTGEVFRLKAPFVTMSRRPGLGHKWFEQFKGDIFPSDFIHAFGRKWPVPAYFVRQYWEDEVHDIKTTRQANAAKHHRNNTPERLAAREESALYRQKRRTRELEDES